jgi:hypothetical protein
MTFFLLDSIIAPLDIVISLLIIFISLSFAFINKNRKQQKNPIYKYYAIGMIGKIVGAIGFCSVYTFYYNGGDVTGYHESSISVKNLLLNKGATEYFNFIFGLENDNTLNAYFDADVGNLYYRISDKYCVFVSKLSSVLELVCFDCFFAVNLLIAILSYSGLWKIYTVFVKEFPQLQKILAYFILLSPSVLFWSSGLNKDSYCFWALGYLFYHLYQFQKTGLKKYLVYLVLPVFIILNIKPYILIAALPASFVFFLQNVTGKFNSKFMKLIVFPVVSIILFTVFIYAYNLFSVYFGDYAIENIIKKAQITQDDLLRDQYGDNKFNIGKIGDSPLELLFKFFPAVNATLFRPYIWEAKNILMIFSGVENLILLIFCVYGLFKLKITNFFRFLFGNSILTFSFIYALLFGFSVGLSVANFGALVRLKIPAIPFFLATVIVISFSKSKKIENSNNG